MSFVIQNPDVRLSDEAIRALARLLLATELQADDEPGRQDEEPAAEEVAKCE